jgi:serine phosphatase RsbU (regulator of sigma subunit)
MIYAFTDGIIDQNNSMRKRFGSKSFIQLLQKISKEKVETQKDIIEQVFLEFSQNCEQRDDITILGLKIL